MEAIKSLLTLAIAINFLFVIFLNIYATSVPRLLDYIILMGLNLLFQTVLEFMAMLVYLNNIFLFFIDPELFFYTYFFLVDFLFYSYYFSIKIDKHEGQKKIVSVISSALAKFLILIVLHYFS
jgi:hypothetical protein